MSISEQFVGRWNLVAWEQRYDDGRLQKPMGEHPGVSSATPPTARWW
jgi:hypothetical protein